MMDRAPFTWRSMLWGAFLLTAMLAAAALLGLAAI